MWFSDDSFCCYPFLDGLPSSVAQQLQLRLQVPYFYPLCSALSALLCKRTVLSQKGLWPTSSTDPQRTSHHLLPDWLDPVTLLAQSSLSPLDNAGHGHTSEYSFTSLSAQNDFSLREPPRITRLSQQVLPYVHPSQMSLPSSPSAGLPEQLALASVLARISLYRSEF